LFFAPLRDKITSSAQSLVVLASAEFTSICPPQDAVNVGRTPAGLLHLINSKPPRPVAAPGTFGV
jgi:hypothetical protein